MPAALPEDNCDMLHFFPTAELTLALRRRAKSKLGQTEEFKSTPPNTHLSSDSEI
jgi:hypothetical protein